MKTLTEVLDMLTLKVREAAAVELYQTNVSQIWGITLLLVVMVISPVLVILAKNAISAIQV